jgi:transposase
MANRRLSMRKIKEVLRLKWKHGCLNRQVAKSCNISRSTVRDYLRRAEAAGLSWPITPELDDAILLFYPIFRPVWL